MSIPFDFILPYNALCCCRPIHGNMNSRMNCANSDTVMESHLVPEVARMDYNMRYAAATPNKIGKGNLMYLEAGKHPCLNLKRSHKGTNGHENLRKDPPPAAASSVHEVATKDVAKNAISAQLCRFKRVGPVLAC